MLLIAIVVGIGYFFASTKSEPAYLSKIDKLMFDNKNKSPQFVLTLPDYEETKKAAQADTIPEKIVENKEPQPQDMGEILGGIPSLNKLDVYEPTQSLKNITVDTDLVDNSKNMSLPKIADNGDKPWFEYGKPVKVAPNFKKVAVVIKTVGFDDAALDYINKAFPSEISISLTPYGQNIGGKIIDLRKRGHETYVDMLLSSRDFLRSDSGPMAMSLTINGEESVERLEQTLATGSPLGGVVINDGIADDSNADILIKVLEALKSRGLLMVDATAENGIENLKIEGLARRKADVVIEGTYDNELIKNKLAQIEEIAMAKGQALLVVEPKPVILTEVSKWIKTFSPQTSYEKAKNMEITKPLALVPVSNLVVE